MKIAATAVGMDAARTYREVEQRTSGLSPKAGTETAGRDFSFRLSRSRESSSLSRFVSQSVVSRVNGGPGPLSQDDNDHAAKVQKVLSQLTEQIIGQPVTISVIQDNLTSPGSKTTPPALDNPALPVQRAELISRIVYVQEETMMFSAQGQVRTVDGREIAFNLGVSMQRSLAVSSSTATRFRVIDPLVLQFDAAVPLLNDSAFLFDLNSDGEKEQLASPGKGCGFLAFDRNSDGVINNGMELFGPATGSGFGELAGFDSDGNQWIDESDPVFDDLLIWSQDGQGGESLRPLREVGVGAISIIHAGSKFQLERADGIVLGTVKASGIFLAESGEVRSLQEIDMALYSAEATEKSVGWSPDNDRLAVAMQTLQNIISRQQFRLRMLLAEQRLQGTTRKAEQRQWLLVMLQNRSEWQAGIAGGNEERTGIHDHNPMKMSHHKQSG